MLRNLTTSGEVQFTSLLLLVVLAAIGYFAYALFPGVADNYTLKQQMSGVVNQAWKRLGKEDVHKQVMEKAGAIGTHIEQPAGGLPIEAPGLPIAEEDVVVVCTDQAQDCTKDDGEVFVTVTYARVMPLPYFKGKSLTLHFSPSVHETLKPAAW